MPWRRRSSRTSLVTPSVRIAIAHARVGTSIVRKRRTDQPAGSRTGSRTHSKTGSRRFRRTIVGCSGRGFCSPTAMFHGVVKVGARRLQGTAQAGFFRQQAHVSMGDVVYYVTYFTRVLLTLVLEVITEVLNTSYTYESYISSSIKERERQYHHSSTTSSAGATAANHACRLQGTIRASSPQAASPCADGRCGVLCGMFYLGATNTSID